MPSTPSPPAGGAKPAPKRALNLTLLTLYGLGTTVGAGIYVPATLPTST